MPDLIGTSDRTDIEQVPENDFVKPADGPDKGYWGYSPETDRDQYTVAGVTGGTAKTLTNKGQAGVGTTVVGTLAFTTGNNGVTFDEKPLVLSVVAGCYHGGGGRHSGRGGRDRPDARGSSRTWSERNQRGGHVGG